MGKSRKKTRKAWKIAHQGLCLDLFTQVGLHINFQGLSTAE